jgi:hypothetical protein
MYSKAWPSYDFDQVEPAALASRAIPMSGGGDMFCLEFPDRFAI